MKRQRGGVIGRLEGKAREAQDWNFGYAVYSTLAINLHRVALLQRHFLKLVWKKNPRQAAAKRGAEGGM